MVMGVLPAKLTLFSNADCPVVYRFSQPTLNVRSKPQPLSSNQNPLIPRLRIRRDVRRVKCCNYRKSVSSLRRSPLQECIPRRDPTRRFANNKIAHATQSMVDFAGMLGPTAQGLAQFHVEKFNKAIPRYQSS